MLEHSIPVTPESLPKLVKCGFKLCWKISIKELCNFKDTLENGLKGGIDCAKLLLASGAFRLIVPPYTAMNSDKMISMRVGR